MRRQTEPQPGDGEAPNEGQETDLSKAWARTQASLPEGWELDGLRCASTGLAPRQRSEEWVAVAIGPHGQEQAHCASDPIEALVGLVWTLRSR